MSKKIYKINYTIGGAAEQGAAAEKNILTLYTTGLGNWLEAYDGNTSNQNILQYYVLYRDNIFSQILRSGFEIEIEHYDPLISEEKADQLIEENKSFIEEMCKSECEIEGIKSSEFIQKEFTGAIDVSKPHLILDFGHVFTYTKNPDVQEIRINDGSTLPVRNLNILRFGFLGNVIPQALFRVDPLFPKQLAWH